MKADIQNVGNEGTSSGTLVAFAEPGGSRLFVGGRFTVAGGVPATGIARWDGIDSSATAIVGTQVGGIPIAVLGGRFLEAGGIPSRGLANYRCADVFSADFEAGDLSEWSASVP